MRVRPIYPVVDTGDLAEVEWMRAHELPHGFLVKIRYCGRNQVPGAKPPSRADRAQAIDIALIAVPARDQIASDDQGGQPLRGRRPGNSGTCQFHGRMESTEVAIPMVTKLHGGLVGVEGLRRRLPAVIFVMCWLTLAGCSDVHTPNDVEYSVHQSHPNWGLDGQVAFVDYGITSEDVSGHTARDTQMMGVWVFDIALQTRTQIVNGGGFPSWSADGAAIVCLKEGNIELHDIGVSLVASYSAPTRSTMPLCGGSGFVYFESDAPGGSGRGIWRLDRALGAYLPLVYGAAVSCTNPAIGDHDAAIYYIRISRDSAANILYDVFRFGLSDSTDSQVTFSGVFKTGLTAARRGSKIAFIEQAPSSRPTFKLCDLNSGSCSETEVSGMSLPSLDDSGSKVVFLQYSPQTFSAINGVLWIWDLDTGIRTPLVAKW